MASNFTRGLMFGTILGAAATMMMPARNNARFRRKVMKNGSHFVKRAIDTVMDMW